MTASNWVAPAGLPTTTFTPTAPTDVAPSTWNEVGRSPAGIASVVNGGSLIIRLPMRLSNGDDPHDGDDLAQIVYRSRCRRRLNTDCEYPSIDRRMRASMRGQIQPSLTATTLPVQRGRGAVSEGAVTEDVPGLIQEGLGSGDGSFNVPDDGEWPASPPIPKRTMTEFEMAKHPGTELIMAVTGVTLRPGSWRPRGSRL